VKASARKRWIGVLALMNANIVNDLKEDTGLEPGDEDWPKNRAECRYGICNLCAYCDWDWDDPICTHPQERIRSIVEEQICYDMPSSRDCWAFRPVSSWSVASRRWMVTVAEAELAADYAGRAYL
jgi:hypothetical protein